MIPVQSKDIRMMAFAILIAIGGFILAPALAQDTAAGPLVVTQPWSRATPGGAKVAGGYLTVTNNGSVADRLVSGKTSAAARVEMHEMAMTNGVMTMRPLDEGLTIAPGKSVAFAPGGYHLMFIDVTNPLKQGDRLPVTLTFEKAGDVTVDFAVQAIGAKAPEKMANMAGHARHASPPSKPSATIDDKSFFQHLHGDKAMANVTIAPARAGPVVITIQLETHEERPLAAQAVTVTLTNKDGAAPIKATAERATDDQWRVALSVPTAGRWDIGLGIQLTATDSTFVDAPILIN